MPTKYKPIISEPESVWSEPAIIIKAKVLENREVILERLNFYDEHGRVGDFEGKFDEQIARFETEVLDEVAGILTLPAAEAVYPTPGVILATLEWVKKNPSAAQDHTLPGIAEWMLAPHYQRAGEAPGTYFADILGFLPNNFQDALNIPEQTSVVKAASAAIDGLLPGHTAGRPVSRINAVLGPKLRPLYLRYNPKITRHSVITWKGWHYTQMEAGSYLDFVRAVTLPLDQLVLERGLQRVSPEVIARLGRYPIDSIKARFVPEPCKDHAPDPRHSAATKEIEHGQCEQ
jgi:hypothetical protein